MQNSTGAVEKTAISRGWVLQELRENVEMAKRRGQGAVVNRGLELEETGLLRHEVHGLAIRARVSQLRAERQRQEDRAVEKAVEKTAISRGWVLQELRENVDMAKRRGQGAVVNRGLELIGREIGMFADQPPKKLGLEDLTAEALDTLIAELEADPEVIAAMTKPLALALPPPRRP
jgi:hypothetical protein